MEKLFLLPPMVFLVIFCFVLLFSYIFGRWAYYKNKPSQGARKAYACGEDFSQHLIQPDYSQFFPFAFFFTILHVMALMIATVPVRATVFLVLPVIYVVSAIIGLAILLRK
jgi:NADH:ubiquinone oxidoreductase subunit 3 (subunit A)